MTVGAVILDKMEEKVGIAERRGSGNAAKGGKR